MNEIYFLVIYSTLVVEAEINCTFIRQKPSRGDNYENKTMKIYFVMTSYDQRGGHLIQVQLHFMEATERIEAH